MPAQRTLRRRALQAIAGCLLAQAAVGSEIMDRVAAIVGSEAVTLSEIDLELRLEALFNESEFEGIGDRGEEVLRRLIDRRLVLQEVSRTPFLLAVEAEVEAQLDQLKTQRYMGGRDFEAALRHYGLTPADCRSFLSERTAFERYVAFRYKTGLDTGQEAIEAYYQDEYAPAQRERGERVAPMEEVSDLIAQILVERQANELLEARLLELRSLLRIESRLRPEGGQVP